MTVWNATQHLLPGEGRRGLTDDEQAEIQDVLDAAMEWQAGRMDWQAAAALGRIERNGTAPEPYTRWVALRYTSRDDPRRQALSELCGYIGRAMGGRETRHGWFSHRQMSEMEQQEHFMFEHGIAWRGVR